MSKYLFKCLQFTALSLLLLSACRAVFYFGSPSYFSNLNTLDVTYAFLHGMRFDFSAFLYANVITFVLLLFTLFRESKFLQHFFSLTNSILYTVHFMDHEFFKSYGRRVDLSFFSVIEGAKVSNLESLFSKYSYLVLLFIIFYAAFFWLYKIFFKSKQALKLKQVVLAFLIVALVSVVGTRGGFQRHKVLSKAHSYLYSNGKAEAAVLTLNSLFSVIRSKKQKNFPSSLVERSEKYEHLSQAGKPFVRSFKGKKPRNVVIVFIESLSAYAFEKVEKQGRIKPFDFLNDESSALYRGELFANGEFSADALVASFFAVPSLFKSRLLHSNYSENTWYGAGEVLKENGYDTFFIHGAPKGSQFFDAITAAAGVTDFYPIYDLVKRNKDFENGWGVHDEILYSESKKIISKYKAPFFATLFTTTSHMPFDPPPGYPLRSNESDLEDDYLNAIEYAVNSLSKFFKEVEKEPWFDETLFILTGDHSPPFRSDEIDKITERNRLPFFMYQKGRDLSNQVKSNVIQHTDISKTVFDILDIVPEKFSPYGKSIFSEVKIHDVNYFYNLNGYFRYFTKDCVFHIPFVKELEKLKAYKRTSLKEEICLLDEEDKIKEKVFNFMDSYIYRLNQNKLYE